MTTPAAPKPDDTATDIAIIFERMTALEARITELETPPEPEPDLYQARLTLNTASKTDRPQALANLNAAKARIRHQADIASEGEMT